MCNIKSTRIIKSYYLVHVKKTFKTAKLCEFMKRLHLLLNYDVSLKNFTFSIKPLVLCNAILYEVKTKLAAVRLYCNNYIYLLFFQTTYTLNHVINSIIIRYFLPYIIYGAYLFYAICLLPTNIIIIALLIYLPVYICIIYIHVLYW